MTSHESISTTAELLELTEKELNDVSGGNIFVGILVGLYVNHLYDAIKGRNSGGIADMMRQAQDYFKNN